MLRHELKHCLPRLTVHLPMTDIHHASVAYGSVQIALSGQEEPQLLPVPPNGIEQLFDNFFRPLPFAYNAHGIKAKRRIVLAEQLLESFNVSFLDLRNDE